MILIGPAITLCYIGATSPLAFSPLAVGWGKCAENGQAPAPAPALISRAANSTICMFPRQTFISNNTANHVKKTWMVGIICQGLKGSRAPHAGPPASTTTTSGASKAANSAAETTPWKSGSKT